MKYGILGCGYNCHKNLEERLAPWFNLAKELNLVFSFISARFKEYEELDIIEDNTETIKKLQEYKNLSRIQHLDIPDEALTEAEARNIALQNLLKENCDYIILLDLSDEFYTEQNIKDIVNYVQKNNLVDWFSIPFKNYIFDGKTWISGFCPPRIFKVNLAEYRLSGIYWDNDCEYINKKNGDKISYKSFSTKSIPAGLLNNGVKHLTWLHTNGKNKVIYQEKHFNGTCSYKWNEEKQELEFNLDYYKKYNIPLPELNYD